jgi:hypothetical protein
MRRFIILCFIGIGIAFTSCRSDFNFEPNVGNLAFSKDTVYLDTIFKKIGSSTYTLKVYNKTNKNIAIPTIKLAKGLTSKYRMMVDGMQGENGKIFNNVELLANDSLYIFIETTFEENTPTPTEFLYTDQIQFGAGNDFQKVELVTLIQDAYFIYPNRVNAVYDEVPIAFGDNNTVITTRGRNLVHNHPDNGDEFTFNATKPYVVYGYASVPANETLKIQPGARVHFHADSGLIVQDNATLIIDGKPSTIGTLDNEVVFEGDRLEPFYSDVPGQWGFIYLRQGSKNHNIKYLTLKNAIVGLLVAENVGTPLEISNSQIYDCSNLGIYAQNANIKGSNLVINNAGQAALACTYGGNYSFTHCTFNNNWPSSKQVAVLVDNYYVDYVNDVAVQYPNNLTQATFTNCIIYGFNPKEISLNKATSDSYLFNYKFNNCLMRYYSPQANPLFDFTATSNYANCIINQDPKFDNTSKNKLNLTEGSPAINTGILMSDYLFDILGHDRPTAPNPNPDIGAYQFKP